jgi:hypothetical protein
VAWWPDELAHPPDHAAVADAIMARMDAGARELEE